MAKKSGYSNDDIQMLEGADRVRKRPAVIFGSNGISGCEHSIFEILSIDFSISKDYNTGERRCKIW